MNNEPFHVTPKGKVPPRSRAVPGEPLWRLNLYQMLHLFGREQSRTRSTKALSTVCELGEWVISNHKIRSDNFAIRKTPHDK